jgi:DNA-binding response OmpR family regulator
MSQKNILIVEDDPTFLMLLKYRIEDLQYDVQTAQDGQTAYDLIQNNHFDLVITDLMMPVFSGMEVMDKTINVLQKKIPFVVMSSAGQDEMVEKALTNGAADFLSKPFVINSLIDKIKNILEL